MGTGTHTQVPVPMTMLSLSLHKLCRLDQYPLINHNMVVECLDDKLVTPS